jgi:transposase
MLAAKLMEEWQDAAEVAHVLGCRRDFVKHWYQRFQQGGQPALQSHNAVGRPSKLNTAQKAVIKEILFNRSPMEFDFSHALWTNRIVLDLIETLYKVKLRMPSINNLLESYGIMHAPFAIDGSPKKILTRVKADLNGQRGKLMLFYQHPIKIASDESGDKESAPYRIGPDRRKRPKRAWLAGAIDARHSKCFMIVYREPVDDPFAAFLEKLVYRKTEPINLLVAETDVWDTPAVHAFLETCKDKIQLIRNGSQPWPNQHNTSGE